MVQNWHYTNLLYITHQLYSSLSRQSTTNVQTCPLLYILCTRTAGVVVAVKMIVLMPAVCQTTSIYTDQTGWLIISSSQNTWNGILSIFDEYIYIYFPFMWQKNLSSRSINLGMAECTNIYWFFQMFASNNDKSKSGSSCKIEIFNNQVDLTQFESKTYLAIFNL